MWGAAAVGALVVIGALPGVGPEWSPIGVALADEPLQEESAQVRAERLFDEALSLYDVQKYAEACPKFKASFEADPSVGALLNIAACSARDGKTIQAVSEYRQVLELNLGTVDPERQKLVEGQAKAALEALEAKIGRIGFSVEPAMAKVWLDGVEITGANEPREVDAGEHLVRFEAAGFLPKEQRITVRGRELVSLSVSLVSKPSEPAKGDRAELTIGAWVTAALGVASGTTGAVLMSLAADRANAIRAECGAGAEPPNCPRGSAEHANELSSEGQAFQAGGLTLVGVGGAFLGTTVVLAILAATSDGPADRHEKANGITNLQVGGAASPDGFGISLSGSF